jgi:hypothetical protein
MKVAEYKSSLSPYLTKEDVKEGLILTIKECYVDTVGDDKKPCLAFQEIDKVFVANTTNLDLICRVTSEDDWDNWAGHKITLFHDPSVMYAGKATGGIRVKLS